MPPTNLRSAPAGQVENRQSRFARLKLPNLGRSIAIIRIEGWSISTATIEVATRVRGAHGEIVMTVRKRRNGVWSDQGRQIPIPMEAVLPLLGALSQGADELGLTSVDEEVGVDG